MKRAIIAILVALVLISSGCVSQGYEGTLKYQEAGDFQCEAYYLVINDESYMINTTLIGNLEDYVNREVRVKGEIIEGPSLRQCQFTKTINAVEFELLG